MLIGAIQAMEEAGVTPGVDILTISRRLARLMGGDLTVDSVTLEDGHAVVAISGELR